MTGALSVQRIDGHPIWGDCVFLEARTDDAEAVREAYAQQAPEWPPLHFAVSRATAEALDPWYRLGFAQMHAYAARPSGGEPFAVEAVALRRGGPDDLETALRIDRLIYEAQAESPSYSSFALDEDETRQT